MNIILHKLNSLLCIQNNTAILWRHQFSVFLILGSVLCTLHSLNTLKINEIDSFLTFRQFSVLPFLFSVFLDRQAPSILCIAILFGCKVSFDRSYEKIKIPIPLSVFIINSTLK